MINLQNIILFDGVCNFCNASVQFIIKRDPRATFKFASLQSEIGNKLQQTYNIPENEDSLILIENDTFYIKSTAALRISKQLSYAWKLFYLFIIVPKPIRDWCYNLLAKNRYRIFGKTDICMIPNDEERKRFLS